MKKNNSILNRSKEVVRDNFSLTVIIVAALLLELTTGVLYYSAQSIIKRTVDRLIQQEMNATYLSIRNQLAKVEGVVDNMAWVLTDDLIHPDSLQRATSQLLEHNPDISAVAISCIPNLFPQTGYWYEPFSVRKPDGTIESRQLGSADHDYTKSEFFVMPLAKGSGHWCEPYLDPDGAEKIVTTYCVPVRNGKGKIVASLGVDFSLDWLDDLMNVEKAYESTQRFLVTGNYNLLAGEDNDIYRLAVEQVKADDDKTGYLILNNQFGRKKHVYFTPVGGITDWMLINVLDDNDVFRKLRVIRSSLLIPLMIGLLIVGFIIYRSSRNLKHLRKLNAEKERIGGELRVASKIQQNMLPQEEVRDERLEVIGSLVPAKEVGGDLYDYFIRDDKLFFCIGDVSGKGAASAMMMAVAQTKFRDFSAHENNPARIMRNINEGCCKNNKANMFVTLFIGVLDLPTGVLRYCDAGHDCPILLEHGDLRIEECKPFLPIGVFEDMKYGVQETKLASNSTIFLYTDGLTEARNIQRKLFGLERVKAVLKEAHNQSPKELLETVTAAVHRFMNGAEQSDDLTLMAIRYSFQQYECIFSETLILKNDVKEVTKFSAFMKSVTAKLDIEQYQALRIRLAVEEAVVNVINYAYPVGQEGEVEVRVMSDGKSLKIVITDAGVAFDPTVKEKADTTLSAEDRQIGGLGILLVREIMDTINYERTDGKNVLTLINKINH